MKITSAGKSYTIDENEMVTDDLEHCDICNEIAAEAIPAEATETEFFATIAHACDNMPKGGTFRDFQNLCISFNS